MRGHEPYQLFVFRTCFGALGSVRLEVSGLSPMALEENEDLVFGGAVFAVDCDATLSFWEGSAIGKLAVLSPWPGFGRARFRELMMGWRRYQRDMGVDIRSVGEGETLGSRGLMKLMVVIVAMVHGRVVGVVVSVVCCYDNAGA
jgi:hypothetical protein